MTNNEIDLAAQIFGQMSKGKQPTKSEREFLQDLLDRMDAAERAGSIAAIIQIMLKEK